MRFQNASTNAGVWNTGYLGKRWGENGRFSLLLKSYCDKNGIVPSSTNGRLSQRALDH
ncbi:MAG: hypothetical protein KC423_19860 [Anaerolineales bacterium]|nr:hypothetical protein [Anaerolineales bacterium]MCB9433450.1 hypothetical protein [Ardenticatenaceae bacterium]